MINIQLAKEAQYQSVRAFYHCLIDCMKHAPYSPKWKKDVYPTIDFLVQSIRNKELYIGVEDGTIVSCMVLNHAYNDGYKDITWLVDVENSQLYVIHILGVHPSKTRSGIAKCMVQKAIEEAKLHHIKTIRLDVLKENLPAKQAYVKMGFQYIDARAMYYEDTGWTDFELYEYVIK